jgi:hypothetical protein
VGCVNNMSAPGHLIPRPPVFRHASSRCPIMNGNRSTCQSLIVSSLDLDISSARLSSSSSKSVTVNWVKSTGRAIERVPEGETRPLDPISGVQGALGT